MMHKSIKFDREAYKLASGALRSLKRLDDWKVARYIENSLCLSYEGQIAQEATQAWLDYSGDPLLHNLRVRRFWRRSGKPFPYLSKPVKPRLP